MYQKIEIVFSNKIFILEFDVHKIFIYTYFLFEIQ